MLVEMAGCSLSGCDIRTQAIAGPDMRQKDEPRAGTHPGTGFDGPVPPPARPQGRTGSKLPDQSGAFSEGLMRIIRDLDGTPALLKANTW